MNTQEISLKNIKRGDNYRNSSDTDVGQLMRSIKQLGLLQPVVVKQKKNGKFDLVAGFRRFHAVDKLGWKTVPVHIYEGSEHKTLLNITENLVREDSTSFEIGRAVNDLLTKNGMTENEVAARIGVTGRAIKQYLHLFNHIPLAFRDCVRNSNTGKGTRRKAGVISTGIATKIIGMNKTSEITNPEMRELFQLAKDDPSITATGLQAARRALQKGGSFETVKRKSSGKHYVSVVVRLQMLKTEWEEMKEEYPKLNIELADCIREAYQLTEV